jgi:flavin reductase (DIM6/NTAB) family NADH-FMN oxidoreductase RutF
MRVDPSKFRNCLGHFATGVTVITYAVDGTARGATVNSFTAISLDPPLVMVSLDRRTRSCGYLDGKPFTVNMLRVHQEDLARHFAGHPMSEPPPWELPASPDRAPRLAGSLAYLACSPWRSYNGGDHVLFLGLVEEFEFFGGDPLVFYGGAFRQIGPTAGNPLWRGSLDSPDAGWFSPRFLISR